MLDRDGTQTFDWALFLCVAAIAVLGVTNLYSATSAVHSGRADIYILQIYWLTIGAVAAVVGYDHHRVSDHDVASRSGFQKDCRAVADVANDSAGG